ncbi:hypothetical protein AB0I45_09185 [Brevibacterium sp. NPDC049920]|mgnify:CR=1 FL=1|uniref:Transcriptional regulator, AbiEi antitoxin, Type IV TA system n=1 Tax=Brevibacterium pityocampae TaxID=506594 RepID=A0ABP8JG72_9MICO|nr:hypothetical protein [uncultured Brevibacterium sp.]
MAAHRIPLYFNPDDHDSYDLSSYSVTARGHVRAPHHGVREHPEWRKTIEIPDWADEDWKTIHLRQLGLQHVRPDCAASHTSAAVLHGMAVPQDLLRHSHVTSMIGVVPIRRRGVKGHSAELLDVVEEWDLRIVARDQTLRQIAGMLGVRDMTIALDCLLGTWHGEASATLDSLRAVAEAPVRYRGRSTFRAALDRARPGVDSPRETSLRLVLVDGGLPEPVVHPPVHIRALGRTIHPDVGYVEQRLAVEYEGEHHRTDPVQWAVDIERGQAFESEGWRRTRVTKDMPEAEVVALTAAALDASPTVRGFGA